MVNIPRANPEIRSTSRIPDTSQRGAVAIGRALQGLGGAIGRAGRGFSAQANRAQRAASERANFDARVMLNNFKSETAPSLSHAESNVGADGYGQIEKVTEYNAPHFQKLNDYANELDKQGHNETAYRLRAGAALHQQSLQRQAAANEVKMRDDYESTNLDGDLNTRLRGVTVDRTANKTLYEAHIAMIDSSGKNAQVKDELKRGALRQFQYQEAWLRLQQNPGLLTARQAPVGPISARQRGRLMSRVPRNVNPTSMANGIIGAANALGIRPHDLATIISFETGGTFNPSKGGPTTKWGKHRGLIQFGEPQARQHGVDWKRPMASQLGANGAIVSYLRAAGVRPGMSLLQVYAAVNAGSPYRTGASDTAAGGSPGTVADKVNNQMGRHRQVAAAMLGYGTAASTASAGPGEPVPGVALSQVSTAATQEADFWSDYGALTLQDRNKLVKAAASLVKASAEADDKAYKNALNEHQAAIRLGEYPDRDAATQGFQYRSKDDLADTVDVWEKWNRDRGQQIDYERILRGGRETRMPVSMSKKQRANATTVFDGIAGPDTYGSGQASQLAITKGFLPNTLRSTANTLLNDLTADPKQRATDLAGVLGELSSVYRMRQDLFRPQADKKLINSIQHFNGLTRFMSPDAAAERIVAMSQPERAAELERYRKAPETQKFLRENSSIQGMIDANNLEDTQNPVSFPRLDALAAVWSPLLEDTKMQMWGADDDDVLKAARERFKTLWGETSVKAGDVEGPVTSRFPVEQQDGFKALKLFPYSGRQPRQVLGVDIPGTEAPKLVVNHDYIGVEMLAQARQAHGLPADYIYSSWQYSQAPTTKAEVDNGMPYLSYRITATDENGTVLPPVTVRLGRTPADFERYIKQSEEASTAYYEALAAERRAAVKAEKERVPVLGRRQPEETGIKPAPLVPRRQGQGNNQEFLERMDELFFGEQGESDFVSPDDDLGLTVPESSQPQTTVSPLVTTPREPAPPPPSPEKPPVVIAPNAPVFEEAERRARERRSKR